VRGRRCSRIPMPRLYVMRNGYAALRSEPGTPRLANGTVSPAGRSSNCPNWSGANVWMLAVCDAKHAASVINAISSHTVCAVRSCINHDDPR